LEQGLAAVLRALSEPGALEHQDRCDATLVATTAAIDVPNASSNTFIRGVRIITKLVCEGCSKRRSDSVTSTRAVHAVVDGIRRWEEAENIEALTAGLEAASELASRSTLRSTMITAGAHLAAADATCFASYNGNTEVGSCALQCLWNLRASWGQADSEHVLSAVLGIAHHLGPQSVAVTNGIAKVLWLFAALPEMRSHLLDAGSVKILQKLKIALSEDGDDDHQAALSWVERSIARINAA